MVAKPTNALSGWTFEEFFGPNHWEADMVRGGNLCMFTQGHSVLIIVKPMLVVGFSHGGRVKKEKRAQYNVSPRLLHKCQQMFYQRGKEFQAHSVFSPKASVEVLLHQPYFIDGLSEIWVLSLPSGAPWARQKHLASVTSHSLKSIHSCSLCKGLGWTSSN